MRLAYENPKSFASGQSVTWMCGTSNGSIIPVTVRVVNVVNDRVVIRVVKRGAVYFKVVEASQLQLVSSADECYSG